MALLWSCSNRSMSFFFFLLKMPELDAALQLGSPRGEESPPHPTGHADFAAAKDVISLLGCKHTLVGSCPPLIHKNPQVLLHIATDILLQSSSLPSTSQNHRIVRVGGDLQRPSSPPYSPWLVTSCTRAGCSKAPPNLTSNTCSSTPSL